jgi:dTDP-glucose 4,6-dehydratase
MNYKRSIIITGGAGFIGSHVVRLFVNKYPDYRIINLDKLTYAGNLANLKDIEDKPNYRFVKMDICDFDGVYKLVQEEHVDGIIHLAAESHVDRSIKDPFTFAQTNVMGTLSLLQAAKLYWETLPEPYKMKVPSVPEPVEGHEGPTHIDGVSTGSTTCVPCRFYHISTDEVYGALQLTHPEGIMPPFTTKASSGEHHLAYGDKFFTEDLKYQPHSPYSAAKASSDHFVRAFHDTYGMPTVVTNCSNNYGPYQFPEKLIPLFINNIRHRKPLPVYGKGENVRDWLFVEDHARAIDLIFHEGKVAETYNIGGFNEWKNIDLIKVLINTVDRLLGRKEGEDMDLITYVTDRAGHDLRYAIDSTKLQKELGWEPSLQFEEGIEKTVRWYLDNQEWMDNVTSGDYQKYYEDMYKNR